MNSETSFICAKINDTSIFIYSTFEALGVPAFAHPEELINSGYIRTYLSVARWQLTIKIV